MLKEGDKAPDFSLPTDAGDTIKLSKLKGQKIVVYFYPKDDTSGCTVEAKDFSCLKDQFEAAKTTIIGISPDSVDSKRKFKTKHDLSVALAADADHAVATAYGVWVEKSMYGKKYMGVERATFLIDSKGKISRIWHKVKVPGHAEDVLEVAKALG